MPTVLGIESSCDETAAAVCKEGRILSNVIASQTIHKEYGGVVPELAARSHIQHIVPTVEAAINKAAVTPADIDAISYTNAPGLIGSLLVGAQFAKSVALCWGKPLYAINHLHAHVASSGINNSRLEPPFICLLASGGHTQLVHCHSWIDMEILGETLDDAAGEAFDKSARLLGFPYPGGMHIEKHAIRGEGKRFALPIARIDNNKYSFSGLKTAVRYLIEKNERKQPGFVKQHLDDLCASVQHAIVETLLAPLPQIMKAQKQRTLTLAGGVAANEHLRKTLISRMSHHQVNVHIPDKAYCGDNAAMIAWLAEKYILAEVAPHSLSAETKARIK